MICDVKINDSEWGKKHWQTIYQFYSRAPYFKDYSEFFKHVYLETAWDSLSELNQFLIKHISQHFLNIETTFMDSRDLLLSGVRQQRLLNLLDAVGADVYISGPAAQKYIDEKSWEKTGIKLVYKNYDGYPEYSQLYPPFNHFVSIIDLLFNVGPRAPYYIWEWRQVETNNVNWSN